MAVLFDRVRQSSGQSRRSSGGVGTSEAGIKMLLEVIAEAPKYPKTRSSGSSQFVILPMIATGGGSKIDPELLIWLAINDQ